MLKYLFVMLVIFCLFLIEVNLIIVLIKYGDIEGFVILYLNVFGFFKFVSKFLGIFYVDLLIGELRF